MPNFNLKYPIAVDVGSHYVYAVQLKQTRKGFEIRGLTQREIDSTAGAVSDADFGLESVLEGVSKSQRFRGRSVALHIPDKDTSVFPIRFQVDKDGSIEEEIIRECEKYLSFPVEEAIIDYPSLSSGVNGDAKAYKATIIAVRREHIEQYLRLMRKMGLYVEAVDYRVSSLIRLHKHLYEIEESPVILCNIGYTETLLCVVNRDDILAQLSIPWGIHQLYEKIRANLELSDADDNAKLLLKTYGLAYETFESGGSRRDRSGDEATVNMHRAVFQIIMPSVDELLYEFHKMISYVRSEMQNVRLECIYLYGYAAWVHHLDSYFNNRLGLPTQCVNPLTEMAFSDNNMLFNMSDGAPFALALGLAMRKVQWL